MAVVPAKHGKGGFKAACNKRSIRVDSPGVAAISDTDVGVEVGNQTPDGAGREELMMRRDNWDWNSDSEGLNDGYEGRSLSGCCGLRHPGNCSPNPGFTEDLCRQRNNIFVIFS